MKKIILVFIFNLFLSIAAFAQSNYTESLTITTYYPAPYGVYRNLKLNPSNEPTNGVDRGVMYYNDTENVIKFRNDTTWVNVTGGGGGYWVLSGNSLTTTGSNYNIGIGTTNPGAMLEVAGQVKINGAVVIGNSNDAVNGSIRFTGSAFEGYYGGTWHPLVVSAPVVNAGVCGASGGIAYSLSSASCSAGTGSGFSGSEENGWTWSCTGSGSGGTTVPCSAYHLLPAGRYDGDKCPKGRSASSYYWESSAPSGTSCGIDPNCRNRYPYYLCPTACQITPQWYPVAPTGRCDYQGSCTSPLTISQVQCN